MRALMFGAMLLGIATLAPPAHAALIFSGQGVVGDIGEPWAPYLYFYDPGNGTNIQLDDFWARPTFDSLLASGGPGTLLTGNTPTPPLPRPIDYSLVMTFEGAPISAAYSAGSAYWQEVYDPTGTIPMGGGDDTVGASTPIPCPPCSDQATISGNQAIFSIRDTVSFNYSQSMSYFQWPGALTIYGELPANLLGTAFTYQIYASTVPEPSSWALLLLGFGGVGAVLRRKIVQV